MTTKFLKLLISSAIFVAVAASASDIYKWTDANGQVHFGQEHPPGVQADQVRIAHDARTPEEKQAAQDKMNKLVHEAGLAPEQVAEQKTEQADANAEEAAGAAERAQACTKDRHLMLKLQNWADRAVVEHADGSTTRLDSIQRQALIDSTQLRIKKNCAE